MPPFLLSAFLKPGRADVVRIVASRASGGRFFTPSPWAPGGYGCSVPVLLSPWRGYSSGADHLEIKHKSIN